MKRPKTHVQIRYVVHPLNPRKIPHFVRNDSRSFAPMVKARGHVDNSETWLDVGCGAGDADGLGCGRARQNNPQDNVDQEAGAGEKDGQEPENADQRRIEIEIFCEACTNTGDFLVSARARETLWSNHARTWGRRAG